MKREEAIRILMLMTERGQERNNEAISIAIKDMIEADRREKMEANK